MSEQQQPTLVYKAILSTKKVVLLREMKIKYQQLAAKAVGLKAGDNKALLSTEVQNEMLKHLIVQIDEKSVGYKDLEDLDAVFTYPEYMQILKVVQKVLGVEDGDAGEPQVETAFIGSK